MKVMICEWHKRHGRACRAGGTDGETGCRRPLRRGLESGSMGKPLESRAAWPWWLLALALALAVRSVPAQAQGSPAVDLELALLVDVSASVSDEEYRLQRDGLAAAFRSPAVIAAVRAAARRGVAIAVIQWADQTNQRVSLDWTLIGGEADALRLAARIASLPRLIHGGHTALGSALAFALREIESNGFAGLRRVIDLSGDGRNNDGHPLRAAREEVIARGITINGLAILNELPLLDRYFRDYLIGGADAFYMVARDYADFAQAMTHKLVREIGSAPLSRDGLPAPSYKARIERFSTASGGRDGLRDRRPFDPEPSPHRVGLPASPG
jgi:hypothetical protein